MNIIAFHPRVVHYMPSINSLRDNADPSVPQNVQDHVITLSSSTFNICEILVDSKVTFFFLNYNPEGTMMCQWYVVHVDLISTASIHPKTSEVAFYYCILLTKYPADRSKSDEYSRW